MFPAFKREWDRERDRDRERDKDRGKGNLHIFPRLGLKPCPRCRGKGHIIEGEYIMKCPKCRGDGVIYEGEDEPLCTGNCIGCIFAEDCYPFRRSR